MTESPTGRIIGRNARLSIDGKEIKSVTMDIDFSGIEMRVLALGEALLEEMQEITGVAEVIFSEVARAKLDTLVISAMEGAALKAAQPKPFKSYLQHDPTKQHRGRRPK